MENDPQIVGDLDLWNSVLSLVFVNIDASFPQVTLPLTRRESRRFF